MRVADQAFPTIGGERPGPGSPTASWPVDLFIGVERQPVAAHVYDDYTAFYDDPEGDFVYDDLTVWPFDRFDLTCYWQGLEISRGVPTADGRFDAATVVITLDNRTGLLSEWDSQGRLVDYTPGRRLDIWAEQKDGGEQWWLFSGEVTAWRELADTTVEVEAFDDFTNLNQPLGTWQPGTYGDTPGERMEAVCDLIGYTRPRSFDTGAVTLHAFASTATPLEELQAAAVSDGGYLACDADGTLLYRDRLWLLGRDDQTSIPSFSSNVCTVDAVVWDAEGSTDDATLANIVTLTNVAELAVEASNPASILRYGPKRFEREKDQWVDQADGEILADWLLSRRQDLSFRLEQFTLYLHDPQQDLWLLGIDRRVGDIVSWVHTQPSTTGPALIVLYLIVVAVGHQITPDGWMTTVATSRAVNNTVPMRYDVTLFTYDDPAPLNVYAI